MIKRLNHVVLYVRDASAHQKFYSEVLDFTSNIVDPGGQYVFMRAPGSGNHHDIALFTVGKQAAPSSAGRGTVGMYHLAWEVETLGELRAVQERLEALGCLIGASDHGVNKSLYASDPDGLEFEVMWLTPQEFWGAAETQAVIEPLNLTSEIERFGAQRPGGN
jgi:catechol-2,3-dioxygenase